MPFASPFSCLFSSALAGVASSFLSAEPGISFISLSAVSGIVFASVSSEASSAEVSAASAAHHLIGKGADLLSVADDGSSVKLCGSVIIEGRIAGHVNRSAVYDDVSVRVNAVRVSGTHDDFQISVIHFKCRRIGRGLSCGIHAVIRCLNRNLSAVYADVGRLKAFGCSDVYASAENLLKDGAVQVWSFGPGLLKDGEITVSASQEVGKAKASNPRTAVAQLGENHYLFVVSDGRTGDNDGLTLYELAQFLQTLGAQTAYNLDGGGSSTMVFMGEVINHPTTNGRNTSERSVSDIVCIGYRKE